MDKEINLSEKQITYKSYTSAYESIRNQFNSSYCCRVNKIEYAIGKENSLLEEYYIEVFDRDSNQLVGYLGEYNG